MFDKKLLEGLERLLVSAEKIALHLKAIAIAADRLGRLLKDEEERRKAQKERAAKRKKAKSERAAYARKIRKKEKAKEE